MRRKLKWCLLALLFVLNCSGCREKKDASIQLEAAEPEQEVPEEKENIYVYVCGAVCQEGVYELPAGSRVYEAIEKAGGFQESAAVSRINQAALLKDEEQIYIPTIEEAEQQESESAGVGHGQKKVNLNTADKEELMTLSGIGESKADSIIRFREEHGSFHSVEDIKQIPGIKDGVYEKIKELITV